MTDEKTKATRLEEIEYNGQKAWRYSDGSIRDDGGHLLAQPPFAGNNLQTTEQSLSLHMRKKELKHEAVIKGANAALAKALPGEWDGQGTDFIEAIAEAQTTQALMAGDNSSTKAAEWVMRHSGLEEPREVQTQGTFRHEYFAEIDAVTMQLLSDIRDEQKRRAENGIVIPENNMSMQEVLIEAGKVAQDILHKRQTIDGKVIDADSQTD